MALRRVLRQNQSRSPSPLAFDSLFIALAPAWAAQPHRPSTSARRRAANLSTTTTARRKRQPQPQHQQPTGQENPSRTVASLLFDAVPSSSSTTDLRHTHTPRTQQDPLYRFSSIPTFQLNNYLLVLARTYRSPPAAFVYEAIRLLRDILYARYYYSPPPSSEGASKHHIGPDRMTFEIILDLLARAIPLHTDLSRKLSEEKREEIRQAKKAAAAAVEQHSGSTAGPTSVQYGSSKRMPAFFDVYSPDAPFGSSRSIGQRPRQGRKIHPEFVLNTLQHFLNSAQVAMLPEQLHYFEQAERHLESASDAGDIFFHPAPARIGRSYLARLAANKAAEAAAKGKQREEAQDSHQLTAEDGGDQGREGNSPIETADLPAPKTPAQTYLSLFALIYSTMVDRFPDSPYLLRAVTPPTSPLASSLRNSNENRERQERQDFDDEHRQWVRDLVYHPQFARSERSRSTLVSSGQLGPQGPTVYGYAARILCFHRVREWAEVQATVRECLARSFWTPPVIKPRSRASAGVLRDDQFERSALPRGWSIDQVVDELKKANGTEKSMFNLTLLSHTLWAWVRVAAPCAPYTTHVEEWEEHQQARQEEADDEPSPIPDGGDAPRSGSEDEIEKAADIALPSPSPLSEQIKSDTAKAVNLTIKALRDVYDLLRDNAMLQEWEEIEALSLRGPAPTSPPVLPQSGDDAWLSLDEPNEENLGISRQQKRARKHQAHLNNREADLSAQLASLARRAATNGWSKDKLWLAQMRALLIYEQRWTAKATQSGKKVDANGHRGALSDTKQKRTHVRESDSPTAGAGLRTIEPGNGAAPAPDNAFKPSRTNESPYAATLRTIFGIPTHPAISPPLPPHIIPDQILYGEFIRLFTRLGDWDQAVEVLADYEQTSLPSTSKPSGVEESVDSNSPVANSVTRFDDHEEVRVRQRGWRRLGPSGGTRVIDPVESEDGLRRSRVVNEMTLPMFDAFFRGFAQHGVQPLPMTEANIHAHLERAQQRVQQAIRRMGWAQDEDDSYNHELVNGVPSIVEVLDVSRFLSMIHPSERGWTLESLVFILEAFKRVRPDCGADSVRRRAQAREAAYLRQWNERRRAHWDPKREGAFDRGLMQDGGEQEAGMPLYASRYEEVASPTPLSPAGRAFFDQNVDPGPSHDEFAQGESSPDLWPVPHQVEDGAEQLPWMAPVGRSLLGQLFGADQDLAASLSKNLPARIFGTRSKADSSPTDFLEVDNRGNVRGFHRAPVPRQLFWVLTALRRVTGDKAPIWVLDQWSLLLHKFGPDSDKHDRLWAEEQARVARWKRKMQSAPGELDQDADPGGEWPEMMEEKGHHVEEEGERNVTLWGTGRHGSLDLRTGEETDANRQGWHSWKFPQRRTSRVVQYLAMSAGIDDSDVRHG